MDAYNQASQVEITNLKQQIALLEKEVEKQKKEIEQEKVLQGKFSQKSSNQMISHKFSDDHIIQQLEQMKNQTYVQLQKLEQHIGTIERNLKQVDLDAKNYQTQEKELQKKDKDLWLKIQELENEIQKAQREQKDQHDIQLIDIQKKNYKELATANENIKSQMYQKQTEKEKERLSFQNQLSHAKDQQAELIQKKQMFDMLIKNRKESIAREYLQSNWNDIQKDISQIHYYFQNLSQTSTHILSKNVMCDGLHELIQLSRWYLEQIKQEAQRHKVTKDNPAYETYSKIWQIFDDNVELRFYINDLLEGIILQTTRKLEEVHQEFQVKKEQVAQKDHKAEFMKSTIQKLKNQTKV